MNYPTGNTERSKKTDTEQFHKNTHGGGKAGDAAHDNSSDIRENTRNITGAETDRDM
jgi:hypothetical protein